MSKDGLYSKIVSKFEEQEVLVVGDLMVDEYIRGEVKRISPEAPVQVVDILTEEWVPGGAGNVIRNLTALGAKVSVLSIVGEDIGGAWLQSELTNQDVDIDGILTDKERPTTRKIRIIGDHQQIVRVDKESREAIKPEFEKKFFNLVNEKMSTANLVLISDYGKGVLTTNVLNDVIFTARRDGIPIIVDPKGIDFKKYEDATYLTPNIDELEHVLRVKLDTDGALDAAARSVIHDLNLEGLLVTRGADGVSLFVKDHNKIDNHHIKAQAQEVYDVTGAGDTVLAVFGLALISGASLFDAAVIANFSAGIVVGKVGTSTVTQREIRQILP